MELPTARKIPHTIKGAVLIEVVFWTLILATIWIPGFTRLISEEAARVEELDKTRLPYDGEPLCKN